jgi:hypothetical protein
MSGLAGGYLAGLRQSRLETERWLRGREDEREKNLRLAIAELTRRLAAGTHEVSWITWKAKHAPTELTEEDLNVYNREMKALFPDIVASRIVVNAIDKRLHTRLTPLVVSLYALDEQVALAAVLFRSSNERCIEALARCYEICLDLDKELLTEVTEMMSLDQT